MGLSISENERLLPTILKKISKDTNLFPTDTRLLNTCLVIKEWSMYGATK